MSLKAIEAMEEFVRKRDGEPEEGLSIRQIKEKIAEVVRCRRNDAYDILMEGRKTSNSLRRIAISGGRTVERTKL